MQSARVARENGCSEKVVLACLLHDISVFGLLIPEHGYWGAQLIEPYVDEEVSWAVRYHQALRFFQTRSGLRVSRDVHPLVWRGLST